MCCSSLPSNVDFFFLLLLFPLFTFDIRSCDAWGRPHVVLLQLKQKKTVEKVLRHSAMGNQLNNWTVRKRIAWVRIKRKTWSNVVEPVIEFEFCLFSARTTDATYWNVSYRLSEIRFLNFIALSASPIGTTAHWRSQQAAVSLFNKLGNVKETHLTLAS